MIRCPTILLLLPIVTNAGPLDDLAEMMQGRFDSHPPGREVITDPSTRLIDSRQRVDAPEIGDAVLSGLSPDDIEPMFREGCGQVWSMIHGSFRGYTDPATCRIISSRTGKPRRIESEALLTKDTLSLVERGYDDDMNQLFGTPQGEYAVLYRIP